jgi:hypothetical protein
MTYGKSDLEDIYDNKSIYHLLDGYADPEEFSQFRERNDALDMLKNYYNELNSAKSFEYLAMSSQGIEIDERVFSDTAPKVAPAISANEIAYVKTKAFQLNLRAQNYFLLNTSEGRLFDSGDFEDKKGSIPVILGENYTQYLKVGDEIQAMYYWKELTLKVAGFLTKDSFIYFNGDYEFYLDDYIILPYIDYTDPETKSDEDLQEIIYFAMINGYISITTGAEESREMMEELEAISKKTNFYNYVFIGSNPHLQQYRGLINVINANYDLIKTIFYFSFLLNAVTLSLLLYFEQKKRLRALAIHYLHGASILELIKRLLYETVLIMFISFLFSQVVLSNIIQIGDIVSQAILFIVVVALTAVISISPIYTLTHKPLVGLLNNEEENL